jgi:hypothetical protein
MSTPNMPGFTAEASVYKTRGYRMTSKSDGLAGTRGVLPQLPIGWCMAGCDDLYDWGTVDNSACKLLCLEASGSGQGGGGGGGVSEPPEPVCGPCIRGHQHCVIPGHGSFSTPCVVGEPA